MFQFCFVNFPFICSNIPEPPMYISQLIRSYENVVPIIISLIEGVKNEATEPMGSIG